MTRREDVISFCKTLKGVYQDYPFHDKNWCVIRHKRNRKVFVWIFEKDGYIWINVKCDSEERDFFRQAFQSILPAYHLNKDHWNSIILDGTVPKEDLQSMIKKSYALTAPKKK